MAERTLSGIGVTPLSGVGTVIWYRPDADLPEPPEPEDIDAEAELARFEDAREAAEDELETERARTADRVGKEEAAVFDAHIQFLNDPQITDGVADAIEGGLPAEHAVQETFSSFVEQFENMGGRMGERADDLRDIRDRLVRVLSDAERTDLSSLPTGSVVVAERLTPSDTAQLDPERVAGFVTVTGGRTSHAAIFARSLALPAIVGVGEELNAVEDDTEVVVDGETGDLVVQPDDEQKEAAAADTDVEIRHDPVETADGVDIEVAANIGTRADLGPAVDRGADGVGLFRTEFLFLDRESPPDEDEQFDAYVEAAESFDAGRVVVRTLDIGGDKPVPYLDLPDEENPFLGERGIRRSLGPDADLFETQIRALLRAAGSADGARLSVMLPLVSTVEELRRAREQFESVADDLTEEGIVHEMPEFGIMVETPATAFMADQFAPHVDFFSIGTNDLAQYVMAAERGNERVSDLGDYRQPAVLRAIDATVSAADDTDCWVGMCGEMAGDPDLTELLVGLGLDELSMSAVTVPQVKAAVTETDTEDAEALAARVLRAETKAEVIETLTENQ
ncbi:phosphoenolpyruvate--protein phosphotransferase [Haloferax mediterranei ATCC 33500]|uniref:Phosphoenolpyruvate-protein phosphotransferase n=1 Tax=Haloferax mediterranei (strain ATCC 33500 / DSM 1411 / JCM 8866 / NBRC 14739 / NCIMB 2177 / R-4) TaxID=523841 RepID=I3R4V7_HALMT|nr:phosphoenolpyruvate--protein phosphotransferase [Haloferax mediterranei]AFK19267.1 sugar phosphotransferase system (PTS) enzyme I [Haloferax mediterranei ATCC 33500]AHZ21374.1 phosphoenolpyruvate-protein phosphotransferase [Haloferax mediterranei ATCC 33500]EMA04544.1 phosphoenolpyruvate-protein phosphotransferase [Haloferax mediterranei ATCC 33500]MDX5989370.1 phosphoenolpyruvate--protein phosphotransferase [Haloferax mediterranei ATCC 33500]QCQ75734.1 phosphoenolpyruvate--protein phosphot